MSSRATRSEKKPLVSTKVSRAINDFVDLAVAEAALPAIGERWQPIEWVVDAHGVCGSDRFESDCGTTPIGQHQALASPHLLHDLFGSPPEIEHRDRPRFAH